MSARETIMNGTPDAARLRNDASLPEEMAKYPSVSCDPSHLSDLGRVRMKGSLPVWQAGELSAAMSAREALMNAPDANLEADPVAGAELSMAGIFASTRSMLALGNDEEAELVCAGTRKCLCWPHQTRLSVFVPPRHKHI